MQIGRQMTELEAFEVLSVVLEHPVYIFSFVYLYYLYKFQKKKFYELRNRLLHLKTKCFFVKNYSTETRTKLQKFNIRAIVLRDSAS